MTPADVRGLTERWMLHGAVAKELLDHGIAADVAFAEGSIHELCHAAVFRLEPSRLIAEKVSALFSAYKNMRASDVSECAALAVERTVFDVLGWPVAWDVLVRTAAEDLHVLSPLEAAVEIDRELGREINARRAGQVLAWLWMLTGKGPKKGTKR